MNVFSTYIHKSNNIQLADSLYDECKNILNNTNSHNDYENGKTTYFDMNLKLNNNFFMFIMQEAEKYLEHIKSKKYNLTLDNVWLSELNNDGEHGLHVHTGSILSGTFYVHTPEGSGNLCFSRHEWASDPFSLLEFKEYNQYNSLQWNFTPNKGDLYIWKSDLPHRVTRNKNDSRITISFNIGVENV